MKKYHVAAGDGKGYYGIGYESYREAEGLLKISQSHDPQAHIVEEEYYFTNADCIRAMSDEELAKFLKEFNDCEQHIPFCQNREECWDNIPDIPEENCLTCLVAWLQKEAE